MSVSPDVLSLLQDMLDNGRTAEDVCRNRPELLAEVRHQWKSFRLIDGAVAALLPETELGPCDGTADAGSHETELPQVPGYRVEGELGRGGMGVVYRAWHLRLDRAVALKMLLAGAYARPTDRERFMREAQAVAGLKHPNIVHVYDVGEVAGRPYFTMELVDGGSLGGRIDGIPQPARQAAALVATLADAVGAAHHCGIVHRDLKPGNILLTAAGTPMITDFGLARRLEGDGDLTLIGLPVGTPSYMAPEQARGDKAAIGPATDLYALGAILYELLTGRPPFRGESATATLRLVMADDPVPPSRLNPRAPRDLETICLKCLEKDPRQRYPSAAALAEDLRRFLRSEPVAARRTGWFGRTARWARRRPSAAVLVVALPIGLLMALTLVGIGLWRQQLQSAVARAFDEDLAEVARLESVELWDEARAAAERAHGRVAVDGTDEQRRRAGRVKAELELAARLELLRLGRRGFNAGLAAAPTVDQEYQAIFRTAGLTEPTHVQRDVASRVMASGVRRSLVAALDDWASVTPDEARANWCLEIASLADPDQDDWRQRGRDPKVWRDKTAITELARTVPVASPPTELVFALAERWARHGGDATEFLRRVQVEHPADFWVNFLMANALVWRGDAGEAIGYYRAALAVRPDAAVVSNNFAFALKQAGRLDEAIAQYERTLRIAPNFAEAHCNLGVALKAKGRLDEALARFRRSVEIKPDFAGGHNNIGNMLRAHGDLAGAMACYESAVRLDPNFAEPHYHLGLIARTQGRHDDSVRHYRAALRIKPDFYQAHNNLGRQLVAAGRLEDGLNHLREAVRIAPTDARSRASLGDALHALGRPDEAVEHRYLAHYLRKEFVAAAKLYADAFAANPALADHWRAGHRARAAGAAALAGCGRGTDQRDLSAAKRADYRKQARDWLRADLVAGLQLINIDPPSRALVRDRLVQWRQSPDLGGVRDAAELDALPADERGDWVRLWHDVDAALARVQSEAVQGTGPAPAP